MVRPPLDATRSVGVSFLRTLLRTTTKSRGDKTHPCRRTTLSTWNLLLFIPLKSLLQSQFRNYLIGTPTFFKAAHIACVFMVSKACSKSTNNLYNGDLHNRRKILILFDIRACLLIQLLISKYFFFFFNSILLIPAKNIAFGFFMANHNNNVKVHPVMNFILYKS